MPRFFKGKNNDIDNDAKARLEHKLYLARENPEPVFDISECALKKVPPGIYSLCKVFRKEALYLQDNQLTSLDGGGSLKDLCLLQILDLHSNCISSLPEDICHLKALQVLNVSHNQLQRLPDAIGSLESLQSLDVSNNQLTELSTAIGNLRLLQDLSLLGNKQLRYLPSSLCHATCLKTIHVDVNTLNHPPKEIASRGVEAILSFLAKEAGEVYKMHLISNKQDHQNTSMSTHYADTKLEAKLMQLDKLKENKRKDMLAMTQEINNQQKREFQLQDNLKVQKERFLENLLERESSLEGKILQVHQSHESERLRLINELVLVENTADEVVSHLLALRGGTVQNARDLQYLYEQERLAEEELLSGVHHKYESLKRRDVLKAMEALLEDEYKCERKMREYEEGRAVTTRTLLSQEVDADRQLSDLLTNQDNVQAKLLGRIQRDEELQRAAVGALLERSDARSWGLVQQVSLVEEQLAALTAVEMKRKKLELSEHLSDLCDKRVELSQLLVELLDQQAVRRKELLTTMEEMEKHHTRRTDNADFWLEQYQRLLDSKPGTIVEMERLLDPVLAHYLLLGGVIHCLPLLAPLLRSSESVSTLTEGRLEELGVCSSDDRSAVLNAARLYSEQRASERTTSAKAPPVEEEGTSAARKMSSEDLKTECVVCMENECEIVFVPCGHMCCCVKCAGPLDLCPMCRTDIQQKIRVLLP